MNVGLNTYLGSDVLFIVSCSAFRDVGVKCNLAVIPAKYRANTRVNIVLSLVGHVL